MVRRLEAVVEGQGEGRWASGWRGRRVCSSAGCAAESAVDRVDGMCAEVDVVMWIAWLWKEGRQERLGRRR